MDDVLVLFKTALLLSCDRKTRVYSNLIQIYAWVRCAETRTFYSTIEPFISILVILVVKWVTMPQFPSSVSDGVVFIESLFGLSDIEATKVHLSPTLGPIGFNLLITALPKAVNLVTTFQDKKRYTVGVPGWANSERPWLISYSEVWYYKYLSV